MVIPMYIWEEKIGLHLKVLDNTVDCNDMSVVLKTCFCIQSLRSLSSEPPTF